MPENAPLVMFSAGEASGDCHAAAMYEELRRIIPGVQAIGMGGAAMRGAGIEICYDSSGIGVIGLAEIAKHYQEIRAALKLMQKIASQRKPDLLICVDYKEFNFRLAKAAKACGVKVLFYVSPQVWAWRPRRVVSYGRIIDHMAVIFPFELPFYQAYNVPATYVGHPLAFKVKPELTRQEALEKFDLLDEQSKDDSAQLPIIGLLPGSRENEIRRMLPVLLESARQLQNEYQDARFLLFQAASVTDSTLAEFLKGLKLDIRIFKGQNYDALQCCDAVITVSGTATLEIALLGLPMVIVYRLSPLSYWIGRLLIKVPFIGLPNILAGKAVVRELIQADATPVNVSAEIGKILRSPSYASSIKERLLAIRASLGEKDGSVELAHLAVRLLTKAPAVD